MRRKGFVAGACFVMLMALPLSLALAAPGFRFSISVVIICSLILYSAIRLSYIAASGTPRPLNLTFWVFVYVFFGLAALMQVGMEVFPWRPFPPGDSVNIAGLVILVGLVGYDVGARAASSRPVSSVSRLFRGAVFEPWIFGLGFVSVVVATYFIGSMGGADMLLQPRVQTFRSLAAEYTLPEILLLTRAISLPVYVAALSAVAIWVSKVSTGSGVPWAWKAFAVLMFAATMIINNPIRTPRFLVGTILFSFWIILPWGKWKNAVAVAALVGGFVIVFPFADLFRSSLEASLGHRLEQSTVVRELTQNGDFDAFEIVSNSVLVMDGEDLLLGRQLSGALFFWVPRSTWATKPRPTGEWLAERMGYEYTNLSAPLWTEFYVDGGILLVVLGFAGYGYVGRRLELWNERNMKSDRVEMITLLVAVAAGYQVFLLRGSLMPAVAYLVPMVVLVFALGLRVRWSKHSR